MKSSNSKLSDDLNQISDDTRRERKRLQLIDHLADTAWQMFQDQGFDHVSMEAIAAKSDVAKATLYKHFPVKEALLAHHLHAQLAKMVPEALLNLAKLPKASERLRTYLTYAANWANAHRDVFAPYVRYRLAQMASVSSMADMQRSGTAQLVFTLIEEGQLSGEFKKTFDVKRLSQYFQSLYLATLTQWLLVPALDLQEELHRTLNFFLAAVSVHHGIDYDTNLSEA